MLQPAIVSQLHKSSRKGAASQTKIQTDNKYNDLLKAAHRVRGQENITFLLVEKSSTVNKIHC